MFFNIVMFSSFYIITKMSKHIYLTATPTNLQGCGLPKPPKLAPHDQKENISENTDAGSRTGSRSRSPFLWNKRISPISQKNAESLNKLGRNGHKDQNKKTRDHKGVKKISNPEQQFQGCENRQVKREVEKGSGESTEMEILRYQLERERKEKGYWKEYALRLQQGNKLQKYQQRVPKGEENVVREKTKNWEQEIERLVSEKIELQKQIIRFQNENRELKGKLQEYEKNEKILRRQISNSLEKSMSTKSHKAIPSSLGSHHEHRPHHERRELENMRKIIMNQDETIFHLNEEITLTKMKLLELKYINTSVE